MSNALACDVCRVVSHPDRLYTRTDIEQLFAVTPSCLGVTLPEQINVYNLPAFGSGSVRGWLSVRLSLYDEVQHLCNQCYETMVKELLRAGAEAFAKRHAATLNFQTTATTPAENARGDAA